MEICLEKRKTYLDLISMNVDKKPKKKKKKTN